MTPEEIRTLLTNGARHAGVTNIQAAVHLLTFTDVPDYRTFPSHVEFINNARHIDGQRGQIATVKDWRALLASDLASYGGSGQYRLLTLAAGLATGMPVDVREAASGLGHAHARRVAEAFLIATGAAEFYIVAHTMKLNEMIRDQRALFATSTEG